MVRRIKIVVGVVVTIAVCVVVLFAQRRKRAH